MEKVTQFGSSESLILGVNALVFGREFNFLLLFKIVANPFFDVLKP